MKTETRGHCRRDGKAGFLRSSLTLHSKMPISLGCFLPLFPRWRSLSSKGEVPGRDEDRSPAWTSAVPGPLGTGRLLCPLRGTEEKSRCWRLIFPGECGWWPDDSVGGNGLALFVIHLPRDSPESPMFHNPCGFYMQGNKTKLEKLEFQNISPVRCEEREPDFWVTADRLVYIEKSEERPKGHNLFPLL